MKTLIITLLLFSGLLFSCTNHMEEYYERPSWLKGNAWDILSEKGDYKIFLSIVDKAGYKQLVNGKGIVTVIAPNDAAFEAYLQQKGYATVDAMPTEEAIKLASYHLVYYSFDKNKFANYNPNGSGAYNPLEAGLYYKHRTYARDPITTEWGLNPNTGVYGNLSVIHRELYIPVFSSYLFDTKQIDAEYNYDYFYPNSTWTGSNNGFNISNASVTEYEIATDNGYLHLVNQVAEPLQTIYNDLKAKGNYSDFLTAYDKFVYYYFDQSATNDYGNGTDLFVRYYYGLPEIASEWTYTSGNGSGNSLGLSGDAYNVFAPDNEAFQNFFNEYWASSYTNLKDVHFIQLMYLLYNHVYTGSIVFPEEIRKGQITTSFGTPISFNPDEDVELKQVCANGSYYGLKEVQVPGMFTSVEGPLFRSSNYILFLYMLSSSGQTLALTSNSIEYNLFIPTDAEVLSAGYNELTMRYYNPDTASVYDDVIQLYEDGWRNMSSGEMTNYVNSHIGTEVISETAGYKVYKTKNNFSYIYTKDNTVASNAMFNENTPFKNIAKIDGSWYNGTPYETDTVLLKTGVSFKSEISSADEVAYLKDYEEFSKLLTKAGLLPLNTPLDFITDNYMVFVPSNEAILNAAPGTIPTDPTALAQYLKYYFVPVSINNVSDYFFPGALAAGDYSTYQLINLSPITFSTLNISEVNGKIHLSSGTGQADVISVLPKVYSDGAAYLIDGLLQP